MYTNNDLKSGFLLFYLFGVAIDLFDNASKSWVKTRLKTRLLYLEWLQQSQQEQKSKAVAGGKPKWIAMK